MTERTAVIGSAVGLHARPASVFAQAAAAAGISVTLTAPSGRSVNAASILGVLSLALDFGHTVTLSAEGDGAEEALDTLAALISAELDR